MNAETLCSHALSPNSLSFIFDNGFFLTPFYLHVIWRIFLSFLSISRKTCVKYIIPRNWVAADINVVWSHLRGSIVCIRQRWRLTLKHRKLNNERQRLTEDWCLFQPNRFTAPKGLPWLLDFVFFIKKENSALLLWIKLVCMKKMIRWRVFIMNFNYLCIAFLLPKPRGSGGRGSTYT